MVPAPTVLFSVSAQQVPAGAEITLNWGSVNADTLKINGYPHPLSGVKQSIVNSTKDYIIEAVGPGGTTTVKIPVRVTTTDPPIINKFFISPEMINEGSQAKITWQATNADKCSIDQGIGDVAVAGQVVVSPTDDTTYKLTATSAKGTTTAICRISVARVMKGGVTAAGKVPVVLKIRDDATGGVIPNGYAITLAQYREMVKGGAVVGSQALTRAQFRQWMQAGVKVGPQALTGDAFDDLVKTIYNITMKGGVKASGAADVGGSKKTYNEVMRGGVKASGFADERDMLPDFIDTGHDKIPVFGKEYTHKAILDGDWNDPETWDVGVVPVFGNEVYIPWGREVVITDTLAAAKYVLLGGRLRFLTNIDTKLYTITVLTLPDSEYIQGTAEDPVIPTVRSILEFADVPINTGESVGMMSLGNQGGGGEEKPFTSTRTTQEPRKGDLGVATEGKQGGNCCDI